MMENVITFIKKNFLPQNIDKNFSSKYCILLVEAEQ